jgi:hypothetical protein
MNLSGKLDRLERRLPRGRCEACVDREAFAIVFRNDWRSDRERPQPADTAPCRLCGWTPQVYTIKYLADWRSLDEEGV